MRPPELGIRNLIDPLPDLLARYPDTHFLVDEAFIGMGGQPVAHLVPDHSNLLVTRTLSKAHSLAGFRVGYAVLPADLADDLNCHNDAYPLARPSQGAKRLAEDLEALGVRTYPTQTYFFLADFAPHDAAVLARKLRAHDIFIKPLNDAALGAGFMRMTTALPEDNTRFIRTLQDML